MYILTISRTDTRMSLISTYECTVVNYVILQYSTSITYTFECNMYMYKRSKH